MDSDLIFPGFLTLFGLALVLFPLVFRRNLEARHERLLAERLRRGEDQHFEELRSLKTYSPPRNRLIYQGIGAAIFVVGVNGILKFANGAM